MRHSNFKLLDHLQGKIHHLKFGENRVGRSPRNDVSIGHPSISTGLHARLVVSAEGVEVINHGINGAFVNGLRVERAQLLEGDTFALAAAPLTLVPAAELRPELPLELIVAPAVGPEVERAWATCGEGLDEDDELWAALYSRWRAMQQETPFFGVPPGESGWSGHAAVMGEDSIGLEQPNPSAWPIRAVATMCSAPMLRHLRNAYFRDDRFQWFVLEERAFVRALAIANHGVGPLFACEIAMNHPITGHRDRAGRVLRDVAARWETDPATYVMRRVPANSTSIADLVGHVFALAQRDRTTWTGREFARFMQRPSFAEAAEWIVFAVGDAPNEVLTTFRALEGALITLDDTVELHFDQWVSVARSDEVDVETRKQWIEHLADFEVVQPFQQFSE